MNYLRDMGMLVKAYRFKEAADLLGGIKIKKEVYSREANKRRRKAKELLTRWTKSRQWPEKDKPRGLSRAALMTHLAEAALEMKPVLRKEGDLSNWVQSGTGSWSGSGERLFGLTGPEGRGRIVIGDATWIDYLFGFEFKIWQGSGFSVILHGEGDSTLVDLADLEQPFAPKSWYRFLGVVWGDFALVAVFAGDALLYLEPRRANSGSDRGGFGFQLPPGTGVLFRDIHARRLNREREPYLPLPMESHRFASGSVFRDFNRLLDEKPESSPWSWVELDTKEVVLTGRPMKQGTSLYFGGPFWRTIVLKFKIRRVARGMRVIIHRLEHPSKLGEGLYRRAEIDVPPGWCASEDWASGEIRMEAEQTLFVLNDSRRISKPYSSKRPGGVLHPIQLIFEEGGGPDGVELKDLTVEVLERAEGF
jgi:hypothetical protein